MLSPIVIPSSDAMSASQAAAEEAKNLSPTSSLSPDSLFDGEIDVSDSDSLFDDEIESLDDGSNYTDNTNTTDNSNTTDDANTAGTSNTTLSSSPEVEEPISGLAKLVSTLNNQTANKRLPGQPPAGKGLPEQEPAVKPSAGKKLPEQELPVKPAAGKRLPNHAPIKPYNKDEYVDDEYDDEEFVDEESDDEKVAGKSIVLLEQNYGFKPSDNDDDNDNESDVEVDTEVRERYGGKGPAYMSEFTATKVHDTYESFVDVTSDAEVEAPE